MPTRIDQFVIEALAVSEAGLLDRVADLTIERNSWRLLARQAIHSLHDAIVERDVLRGQIRIDRRRDDDQARRAA